MRVFVIGGKAGAGKSTLAKLIKEYYDLKDEKSVITEYSKYVKLLASEMIGWDKKSDKPRAFLQDLGQDMRKILGANVFIDRMKEDITMYQKYFNNVIISDARLIPEITLMKTKYANCYTIHLLNDNDNTLTDAEKKHVTEVEFDNYEYFDYTLKNKNMKQLREDIYHILEEIE